jgi:hypothetical protein
MSLVAERRKSTRFRMSLPCLVRWTGAGRERITCRTVLRDLGAEGLYFALDRAIPPAAPVTVVISLASGTRLAVRGRVVRTAVESEGHGHAVQFRRYHFLGLPDHDGANASRSRSTGT